jgi:hypothetical protein
MPSPDFGGARHARLLDFSFSLVAMVSAGAVWLAGAFGGPLPDVVLLTKLSFAVLLVSALTGIWLIERSAEMPRHSLARVFWAIRHRLENRAQHRVVLLPRDDFPGTGLWSLVADGVEFLGGTRRQRPDAAVYSLDQAQKLVSDIFHEADGLNDVFGALEEEEAREQRDLRIAGSAGEVTQAALSHLTDRVVSLTAAVRSTTAEAQRVVSASVALSEQAFSAQRNVAALDDQTASLEVAIEQVEHLLHRLEEVSRSAEADGALAAELRALASASMSTVGALAAGLGEMKRQADEAARSAADISARVAGQHDLGLALSHAVAQQGDDVSDILRLLDEAQSGFVTLRASVEAVSRHGPARLAKANAVRAAAERLPGHAESLETVLRLLPDFAPDA